MEVGINFHCIPVDNGILSLEFKNIKCFDLNRFLLGSLANNAEKFKCENQKVAGYNHYEIQLLYEQENIKAFYKKVNSAEGINYLTMDVKVLEELFNKFNNVLADNNIKLTSAPTIGSLVMKEFKKWIKDKNIILPRLT